MGKHFQIILIPLVLFTAMVLAVPYLPLYGYDNMCWALWSTHDLNNGLGNAYNDEGSTMRTNYLPLYHYILYVYGCLAGSEAAISANVHYLKLFTLAVDWLGLWYVWKWTGKTIAFHWLLLISFLNLGYGYNTLLWGQIDGIVATFLLITTYYGYNKKTVLSAVFFVLALNTKLQAIVFLPVWGYFYLSTAMAQRKAAASVAPLFAIVFTQAIILLPFSNSLPRIWEVATHSVGQYPKLSMCAFNYWYLVLGEQADDVADTVYYFGQISYRVFGLCVFALLSLAALYPMIRQLAIKVFGRGTAEIISKERVWLICTLLGLLFFFFNTEMHERYSHPALIFVTAYSVYRRDFIPYLLVTAAYFLNMEKIMAAFRLPNYDTLIFDARFIAGVYLLAIIYLFYKLYAPRTLRNKKAP